MPEHEVADALLASRTNHQVRHGQVTNRQMLLNKVIGDVGGRQLSRTDLLSHFTTGLGDIPMPAIISGDNQRHPGIVASKRLGALHMFLQVCTKRGAIADNAQADVVAVQLFDFPLQRKQEQAHQGRHFILGTAPVLAGKRKQGKYLHPFPGTGFNH